MRRPWRRLLVTIWIGCIWFMSAHPTPPGDPIGKITRLVQGTALQPPVLPGRGLSFSVGKLGHLWEYCVLGALLAWALAGGRRVWLAVPLGALVAALDETIQRFVPGREGCLRDVGIDVVGLALGVLVLLAIYRLLHWLARKRKTAGAGT